MSAITEAKAQARALRAALAAQGTAVSHGQALELVARQAGARDWNTLHARLSRAEPRALRLEDRVRGFYLGQPFSGRIVALSKTGQNRHVSIAFDEAVDTVRFASFSNLRRRVQGVIGPDGRSLRKTSDGVPQLIVFGPEEGT
ncbi:glyoxalase superfamily protein [Primorskyibacter sp. 2E107]|uniref:glyoxalase superfamily protein n=1 Tax=Primorskyibacter sp. 2E107 TaxID=3403458 RepID=UPI003AF94EFF